jgi:hypothetical protein
MENNLQNTILDNSNNILDLNAIENIVINNANIVMHNSQEKLLNLNEIDLPLERNIPFIVRQNAFRIN